MPAFKAQAPDDDLEALGREITRQFEGQGRINFFIEIEEGNPKNVRYSAIFQCGSKRRVAVLHGRPTPANIPEFVKAFNLWADKRTLAEMYTNEPPESHIPEFV